MERNVEIKCTLTNREKTESLLKNLLIQKYGESNCQTYFQKDTFYYSQKGRLKIREFSYKNDPELIHYHRLDTPESKLSSFHKMKIMDTVSMKKILEESNGSIGIIGNKRTLYMYDKTRIHLDSVEDLGEYLEIEVQLEGLEKTIDYAKLIEDGKKLISFLIEKLEIQNEKFIDCSYFDLLK